MKHLILAAIVVALSAVDAEACVAGRSRGRQVSRARTVTQSIQTVAYVPKVVEKTVYVPQVVKQTVMVPVVTSTPVTTTVERFRVRGVVRDVVSAPLRLLPCPGCK